MVKCYAHDIILLSYVHAENNVEDRYLCNTKCPTECPHCTGTDKVCLLFVNINTGVRNFVVYNWAGVISKQRCICKYSKHTLCWKLVSVKRSFMNSHFINQYRICSLS